MLRAWYPTPRNQGLTLRISLRVRPQVSVTIICPATSLRSEHGSYLTLARSISGQVPLLSLTTPDLCPRPATPASWWQGLFAIYEQASLSMTTSQISLSLYPTHLLG